MYAPDEMPPAGARLTNAPPADAILTEMVRDLADLGGSEDEASWRKATTYVTGRQSLCEHEPYKAERGQKQTRLVKQRLYARAEELGVKDDVPRPSFLANAWKMEEIWEDIFNAGTKDLPYDHYRQMAVCSLPRDNKDRLRAWAESERPKREVLRQRIRDEVDAHNGEHRPDFELKVSNYWKFNEAHENGAYGGIHPGIYANLMYWFTDPGDTVLDPCAGTGLLEETLRKYRFFRETYEAESSGPRRALMSDISPTRPGILQADARRGLPFDAGVAELAIVDPPYFRVADDKRYANFGATLDEWLDGLHYVAANVARCVRPGGLIAVVTDDVLRTGEHVPIAYLVTDLLRGLGLEPAATIYNNNPNYVYTMGPAMMKAAILGKKGHQLNGCKIIQVARKPS
jgi:hypothetical protein